MSSGAGAIGAHAEQVVGPAGMAFNVPPQLLGADRSTIGRVLLESGPPATS